MLTQPLIEITLFDFDSIAMSRLFGLLHVIFVVLVAMVVIIVIIVAVGVPVSLSFARSLKNDCDSIKRTERTQDKILNGKRRCITYIEDIEQYKNVWKVISNHKRQTKYFPQ